MRDQGRCEDFAFGGGGGGGGEVRFTSRSSESVFGHVPPGHDASERLYLVGRLLTLILRLHTALSMSLYCTKSGIASYNGKNA